MSHPVIAGEISDKALEKVGLDEAADAEWLRRAAECAALSAVEALQIDKPISLETVCEPGVDALKRRRAYPSCVTPGQITGPDKFNKTPTVTTELVDEDRDGGAVAHL